MFERIRKALSAVARAAGAEPSQEPASQPVSDWAASRGMQYAAERGEMGPALQGKVAGRPWRMEVGRPSRNYIHGDELRARAELRIDENIAALVIGRALKDVLERKAYDMITDTLRTTAHANLPEEMRWLSMFDESVWDELPEPFWARYAVLAERRNVAQAWVDPALAQMLLNWPLEAPGREVPFLLVLLRGKCYLRMEYMPADTPTLQHAATVFTRACERAVDAFGR